MARKIAGRYEFFSNYAWFTPGVADLFIFLAWMIVGALLGSLVTFIFSLVLPGAGNEFAMLVSYPLQFLPALIWASGRSRANSWDRKGYALDNKHFAPVGGAVCAILVVVGTIATAFASDALGSLLPPMPEWIKQAMESLTGGNFLVDFVCVSIMAPLFEEWLCRGMILRGLLHNKVRPGWAIVISAVFFAVIHLNPWQAIPAFLLGCLFGYVYYKTGSLLLTMLMHFTNNTMALVIGQIPSLESVDSWVDLLGTHYWPYFVLALVVLGLVIVAFRRIQPVTPEGSFDSVPAVME